MFVIGGRTSVFISFPLESILLPKNAEVVVLEHTSSKKSDEEPEIVHVLSEQPGNIARVTNKGPSDAFRKAWYKLSKQKKSPDARQKRLGKRRDRYEREKALTSVASDHTDSFNSDQTDISWSLGGGSTASSSCAAISDGESSNDSQAPENPESHSSDASVLASSGSSRSFSEVSSERKELGDDAKNGSENVYASFDADYDSPDQWYGTGDLRGDRGS
ncbi:hypothetical protein FGB62_38g04 [Gracilaria domingensis]|nr:hypothetical protein FGB62_38g04 [Gracilaria domingensis]